MPRAASACVLARKGVWLVKAVHMVPAPSRRDADWQSLWASLTFEIQAGNPVRKDTVKTSLLLALLLSAAACACVPPERREIPAGAVSKPPSRRRRRSAPRPGGIRCKGIVVAADPAEPEIIVQHEEIPGYMAAMTMAFPVRDDPKVIGTPAARRPDRGDPRRRRRRYFLEQVLTKGFVPTPTPVRRRRRRAARAPTRAWPSGTRSRTSS